MSSDSEKLKSNLKKRRSSKTHQVVKEKKRLVESSRVFASPGIERVLHLHHQPPPHSPSRKIDSVVYSRNCHCSDSLRCSFIFSGDGALRELGGEGIDVNYVGPSD